MIVFCYDDYYEEYKDCLSVDIGVKEARRLGLEAENIYDVVKLQDYRESLDLIVCDFRKISVLNSIAVMNQEKDGNDYLSGVPVIVISFLPQASIDESGKYFGTLNIVGHFDARKRFEPEAFKDLLKAYQEGRIVGYGYESERSESIPTIPNAINAPKS